jgi:hypothetical protein
MLIIGTMAEYILLTIHLSFLLYTIYLKKKILKIDPKASEEMIKSDEFFIYLQPAQNKWESTGLKLSPR